MWKEENHKLTKTFEFDNFIESIAFVVKVSMVCEKLNHHPEITVRYNKVYISSTTHDAGNTITQKDFSLADHIDAL